MNQPAHEQVNLGLPGIFRFPSVINGGEALQFLNYRVAYPPVVVTALGQLYQEYNLAFQPLVAANREWDTDYRFALYGPGGTPINFAVQIDMCGLTAEDLRRLATLPVSEVVAILRHRIFEFENSLAMYGLLERCCVPAGGESFFRPRWRQTLQHLRDRHRMPVALLAVTDQKYQAMLEGEFGKRGGEAITDAEVNAISGFDRFFSPAEFEQYLRANGGRCGYLLYVRSSDPVDKLKKPNISVKHPLLGDPVVRRIIKAHSVTFNIDAPDMLRENCINDTKRYLPIMSMGFSIRSVQDMFTSSAQKQMAEGCGLEQMKGAVLSGAFSDYLRQCGVDPLRVISGHTHLRAKPIQGTYGCYGHHSGPLNSREKFRAELAASLRKRGEYIVQPEMASPRITNLSTGDQYEYIDRVFMGTDGRGRTLLLGGFRSLLSTTSHEVRNGRNHGNPGTHWAAIVG